MKKETLALLIASALAAPVAADIDIGGHVDASRSDYTRSIGLADSNAALDFGFGNENLRLEVNFPTGYSAKIGGRFNKWRIYAGAGAIRGQYSTLVNVTGVMVSTTSGVDLPYRFVELQREVKANHFFTLRVGQADGSATFYGIRQTGWTVPVPPAPPEPIYDTANETRTIQDMVIWAGYRFYF